MNAPASPPTGWAQELGRFLEIQNLGLNLPFGLAFLLAASQGLPRWQTLALVVIALIAARNAGHSFNRWSDRFLDARNPRTQQRALVTGRMTPAMALTLTVLSSALLIAAAYFLNPLSFELSPVALALIFGYSYTKRFTSFTTVFLGLVEALVPAGVFIAVTGALPLAAVVAVFAILAWGTAFETIHSLGDLATDETLGLYSLPRRLGRERSVLLVAGCHAVALGLLALFGLLEHFGLPYWIAWGAMAVVVVASDLSLPRELDHVRAPFQRHFVLAMIFLVGVVAALALPGLRF